MSYSHSEWVNNGGVSVVEHWYKCDLNGQLIHESHPRIHIEGKDADISFNAVHDIIMPWFVKCAPVDFDLLVADMKQRAGLEDPRRPTLPAKFRQQVIAEEGGKCRKCGSTERLQVDHIKPVAKGGGDERSNLQALCQPCNGSKYTKDNDHFMAHG